MRASRSPCLLELLPALYPRVVVPPAVANEVRRTIAPLPTWLDVVAPPLSSPAAESTFGLGSGEQEAIALALAVLPTYLVVDDRDARRRADRLGVPTVGTAGIVVQAKRAGLVLLARPILDRLRFVGLFVGDDVYRRALVLAAEWP